MLSAELLDRLQRLNRDCPLSVGTRRSPAVGPREPLTVRRRAKAADRAEVALPKLVPGRQVENYAGSHYQVRRRLAELWHNAPRELAHGLEGNFHTTHHRPDQHPELAALAARFPRKALFLDLETCGFAGSAIFLVGLLCWHRGELALEQLLARDYSEERAMLASLWQRTAANEVLVTFNGKSFDWPMIHDRSTYHHLGRDPRGRARGTRPSRPCPSAAAQLGPRDPRPELLHCDLLHHARRRWKSKLPNCRLQTLERYVCRRVRQDDIPGSQIPRQYHAFVRTGDARQLDRILHHNAVDLVTLAHLALWILK